MPDMSPEWTITACNLFPDYAPGFGPLEPMVLPPARVAELAATVPVGSTVDVLLLPHGGVPIRALVTGHTLGGVEMSVGTGRLFLAWSTMQQPDIVNEPAPTAAQLLTDPAWRLT